MSRLSLLSQIHRYIFRHHALFRSLSTSYHKLPTHCSSISSSAILKSTSWSKRVKQHPFFSRQLSSGLPGDGIGLEMPSLSSTMDKGSISSWLKKEGDRVNPGDAVAEIETDKATIEWELTDGGYLAKIFAPAGTKDISIGTLVAVLVDEEKDIVLYQDFQPGSSPVKSESKAEVAVVAVAEDKEKQERRDGADLPLHTVIGFPALSPTMEIGGLGSWTKKEGDFISSGETICSVVTDKATNDFECLDEGYLAKILMNEGTEDLKVGTPIAILVEEKDSISAFKDYVPQAGKKTTAASPAKEVEAPPMQTEKKATFPDKPTFAPSQGDRIVASPYAKKLASEAHVSLMGVTGSGPNQRIVAADIHDLINRGVAVPSSKVSQAPFTDIQQSQIRKVTAERLLYSKQNVPHYYLTVDCQMDELMELRKKINSKFEDDGEGIKLSVNDFIIKAAALALKNVPEVNSSWQGDFIRQYKSADISIAVQTPAGLMVPIVKNAETKGLQQISSEVKSLANKVHRDAKEGKLRPEEFTGGTFTISNLGMFGIKQFCAIVNPPQAAILAIGSTQSHLHQDHKTNNLQQKSVMSCTLSCDHRVVDGAIGANWLKEFRNYMEQPFSMLL